MNYDDELRKLFTEDALDVQARDDAEQLILAGAKRARTRRTAGIAGAAVAAVLVIGGGIAFGGDFARPDRIPVATPEPSQSSTTSTAPSEPPPPSEPPSSVEEEPSAPPPEAEETITSEPLSLGPDGLGELTLGMTEEEAEETGKLAKRLPTDGTCVLHELTGFPGAGFGLAQFRDGRLVEIYAPDDIGTPAGLKEGMPLSEITERHPDATKTVNDWRVDVEGKPGTAYVISPGYGTERVASISLALMSERCAG